MSTDALHVLTADNRFAHLTNASVAKHSPTYGDLKDTIGAGNKWLLSRCAVGAARTCCLSSHSAQ